MPLVAWGRGLDKFPPLFRPSRHHLTFNFPSLKIFWFATLTHEYTMLQRTTATAQSLILHETRCLLKIAMKMPINIPRLRAAYTHGIVYDIQQKVFMSYIRPHQTWGGICAPMVFGGWTPLCECLRVPVYCKVKRPGMYCVASHPGPLSLVPFVVW